MSKILVLVSINLLAISIGWVYLFLTTVFSNNSIDALVEPDIEYVHPQELTLKLNTSFLNSPHFSKIISVDLAPITSTFNKSTDDYLPSIDLFIPHIEKNSEISSLEKEADIPLQMLGYKKLKLRNTIFEHSNLTFVLGLTGSELSGVIPIKPVNYVQPILSTDFMMSFTDRKSNVTPWRKQDFVSDFFPKKIAQDNELHAQLEEQKLEEKPLKQLYISVGIYGPSYLEKNVERLLKEEIPIRLKELKFNNNATQLMSGPFDSDEKASKVLKKVKLLGYSDAYISKW